MKQWYSRKTLTKQKMKEKERKRRHGQHYKTDDNFNIGLPLTLDSWCCGWYSHLCSRHCVFVQIIMDADHEGAVDIEQMTEIAEEVQKGSEGRVALHILI
jgi:hypothetical protein